MGSREYSLYIFLRVLDIYHTSSIVECIYLFINLFTRCEVLCIMRSDKIVCKLTRGGIGIGPYRFMDNTWGYVVIPECTHRDYHKMSWGLCGIDTNDYLNDNKDRISGMDRCKHLDRYNNELGVGSFRPGCIPHLYCKNFVCDNCNDYFLPNLNELLFITRHKDIINECDPRLSSTRLSVIDYVWSSTSYSKCITYIVHIPSNTVSIENRYRSLQVLPIRKSLIL